MADLVLHGLETIENNNGPRPVETIDTGIILLAGTAPDANDELYPYNKVIPIYGSNGPVQGLGTIGTLPDHIEGIFDQASRVSQTILLIRVPEGATLNQTMQNLIGSSTALTGIYAALAAQSEYGLVPKLLCAPGYTSQRPTDAVASILVGNAGAGYADEPEVTITGGGGFGAKAVSTITNGIAVEVEDGGAGYTAAPTVVIGPPASGGVQAVATATVAGGAVTGVTITNPGAGYTTPPPVAFEGGGGAGAEAMAHLSGHVTGIVITNHGFGYDAPPTVTIAQPPVGGVQATATATIGTAANPVTVELLALANRFRAGVIKDGTATSTLDAIADRLDYDTDRLLIVEPMVKVFKNAQVVPEPASARIAGLQAKVDYTEGFWVSPSNHVVNGIIGISRPIGHSISDPSAESQLLNRNSIACIVRSPSGGYKLWGNRVPSSDSLRRYWSVRRAHDTIIDSIERASEPFIDKPFSLQNLIDIAETVNSALRRWRGLGATLGGRVWLDATLNTAETWAAGHLYVSYDAEAPAPIEHITFMFNRNTGYYTELANTAIREIARLAGTALPAA